MKIRPMGAELFPADWQTDKTKSIETFRSLSNARNKTSTKIR